MSEELVSASPEPSKPVDAPEEESSDVGAELPPAAKDGEKEITPGKKFRVKIDGEELDVDEEELRSGYQRAQAANKRFAEAKELYDQLNEFAETLQTDPLGALIKAGIYKNESELADAVLEILKEQDSGDVKKPVDPELSAKEKEIADREASLIDKYSEFYMSEYERTLPSAVEEVGLPVNTRTIAAVAHVISDSIDRGYEITPKEAANEVKEYFTKLVKTVIDGVSDDELLNYLSDQAIDRVNKHRLARAKQRPSEPKKTAAKPEEGDDAKLLREALKKF